mgnify:FL=1
MIEKRELLHTSLKQLSFFMRYKILIYRVRIT